jgi:hypothetical protein
MRLSATAGQRGALGLAYVLRALAVSLVAVLAARPAASPEWRVSFSSNARPGEFAGAS